jgi:hypothetical protein
MRNRTSSFWQKAAQSLPAHVRTRYSGYFAAAERWDARLDGLSEFLSHYRLLRRPRSPSASSSSG